MPMNSHPSGSRPRGRSFVPFGRIGGWFTLHFPPLVVPPSIHVVSCSGPMRLCIPGIPVSSIVGPFPTQSWPPYTLIGALVVFWRRNTGYRPISEGISRVRRRTIISLFASNLLQPVPWLLRPSYGIQGESPFHLGFLREYTVLGPSRQPSGSP